MITTSEWHFEYLPYTVTEADGSERELPHFRIYPALARANGGPI